MGQLRCLRGSTTMLAVHFDCKKSRIKWQRLAYRLPIEGSHLGVVSAPNVQRCREVCDMMPGCNSFARVRMPDRVICHMKGRCAEPGSSETRLDSPNASPAEQRARPDPHASGTEQ